MKQQLFIMMCLIFFSIAGCTQTSVLVNYIVEPIKPKPKIKAEHSLSNKDVLVWVDITTVSSKFPAAKRMITERMSRELVTQDATIRVVDYAQIQSYLLQHQNEVSKSIAALGQHFKCDEVVYIFINRLLIDHHAGKGYYQPIIGGYLKVINADDGIRLWPQESLFKPFSQSSHLSTTNSNHYQKKILKHLIDTFSVKSTKYFYEHRSASK